MENNKTAEAQAAENKDEQALIQKAEKQQQENSPTDGRAINGQDGVSVGKENANNDSPFDNELEQLHKLAEHQKIVIEHKERALQAEKKKNKELANKSLSDDTLVEGLLDNHQEELKKEIESLKVQYEKLANSLDVKTITDEVKRITNDAKEQEAILLAKEVYKLNSGDAIRDLYAARAIVNSKAIFEEGKKQGYQEVEEENGARYSLSKSSGRKSNEKNTYDHGIADLLHKFNRPDAIKFIK